jgi:hypothetical protein
MTDDQDHTQTSDKAEAAMNEVLAADQAAAEVIDACAQEARVRLHEATQRARHIEGRTNERIALIQQRIRLQLQRRLRDAERAARAADRAHEGKEDPRLAVIGDVVNDLAAQLTGAGGSDKSQAD